MHSFINAKEPKEQEGHEERIKNDDVPPVDSVK